MDSGTCDILHSVEISHPVDVHGCILPSGHDGPHEFKDEHGRLWQWETDLSCQCEHCMRCEGDYCTTYWRKEATHGN